MTRAFLFALGLFVFAFVAWPQRPDDADAAAVIEQTRQKALGYTRSLPDFVCTEVIRRFIDTRGRGVWNALDKLTVKLSYFEQQESHKLVLIDDKPTERPFGSMEGTIGVGEFGSTLRSIFEPTSQASFHWQSWRNLRGHRVALYSYAVSQANSRYLIVTGKREDPRQAIVSFHGTLEIDTQTGAVLHFNYLADHIPRELALNYAETIVDYDFAAVGGQKYLLPSHSETQMRSPRLSTRNEMEFRDYGKFSSDSTITFGDGK